MKLAIILSALLHAVLSVFVLGLFFTPLEKKASFEWPEVDSWVYLQSALPDEATSSSEKMPAPSTKEEKGAKEKDSSNKDLGRFFDLGTEVAGVAKPSANAKASGTGTVYSGEKAAESIQGASVQISAFQKIKNLQIDSKHRHLIQVVNRAVQYPPELVEAKIEGQLRIEFDFDLAKKKLHISKIRASNPYLSAYVARKLVNTLDERTFKGVSTGPYVLHTSFILKKMAPVGQELKNLQSDDEFSITNNKLAVVRYALNPLFKVGPVSVNPGAIGIDLMQLFDGVQKLYKTKPSPLDRYRHDPYFVTELG